MNLDRSTLDAAVAQTILRPEQADALWRFLAARNKDVPSFRFAHVLYYLGGLVAIAAMTLFMTKGWERFGGTGMLTIAAVYFVIAYGLTRYLLDRGHPIPAGITGALAVVMVPLAVYAAQIMMGWWPEGAFTSYRDYHYRIDWRWLMMELATLAVAVVLLWRFPLPFMVLPVAVTLWYMSMDVVPFLLGMREGAPSYDPDFRKIVSVWFGVGMAIAAFWVDLRMRRERRKDYAFWLYVFGVAAFWGGLSLLDSNNEWSRFLYCCINIALIFVGALLARRVFAVFGGIGVAIYLGHLASKVFKDSMLFPLALSAIGLMVVGLGILWQRHEDALAARLRRVLPASVRELLQ